MKNLAVVTPGFSADCLETLEEIAVENADIFRANGGENFAAIPCLNDSEAGMAVIAACRAARTARLDLRAENAPNLAGEDGYVEHVVC